MNRPVVVSSSKQCYLSYVLTLHVRMGPQNRGDTPASSSPGVTISQGTNALSIHSSIHPVGR